MHPILLIYSIIQYGQGLIQKEKAHINCEKGNQINILASKIARKWWLIIIIKESKQTRYSAFIFYFLVIMFTLHWWVDKKNWNCI